MNPYRCITAPQMQIALRERDFDIVVLKDIPDVEQNFADDVAAPVLRIGDPEPDFKIDRVVAKAAQQCVGAGVVLYTRAFCCGFIAQFDREMRIAVIGNANRDFQAQLDV